MVPGARLVTLPLLGHLAHEEDPASTADLMLGLARESGVLA
jgi:magnesium chelatase accessory protein